MCVYVYLFIESILIALNYILDLYYNLFNKLKNLLNLFRIIILQKWNI